MESYNEQVDDLRYSLTADSSSVFRIGTKFDKDPAFYNASSVEGSHLNMTALPPAKARKDMFQPYFSKASIGRLEPAIQAKVSRFVELVWQAGVTNEVVDLSYAFSCLTVDIITDYCFQKSPDALEAESFEDAIVAAFMRLVTAGRFEKYVPAVIDKVTYRLLTSLPRSVVAWMAPDLGNIQRLENVSFTLLEIRSQHRTDSWSCI